MSSPDSTTMSGQRWPSPRPGMFRSASSSTTLSGTVESTNATLPSRSTLPYRTRPMKSPPASGTPPQSAPCSGVQQKTPTHRPVRRRSYRPVPSIRGGRGRRQSVHSHQRLRRQGADPAWRRRAPHRSTQPSNIAATDDATRMDATSRRPPNSIQRPIDLRIATSVSGRSPSQDHFVIPRPSGTSSAESWYLAIGPFVAQAK